MKKILILLMTVFILTSCNNKENTKIQTSEETNTQVVTEIVPEVNNETDINIETENRDQPFVRLEANLQKLKNIEIDTQDFEELNFQIKNLYIKSIQDTVMKNKNIKLCNLLDANDILSCKKQYVNLVATEEGNTDTCKLLEVPGEIAACNNNINGQLAYQKLDIALCEKITETIANTPEAISNQPEILNNREDNISKTQDCKNNIYNELARQNKDIKLCNKIVVTQGEDFVIDICKEDIKMRIEMEREASKNINQR